MPTCAAALPAPAAATAAAPAACAAAAGLGRAALLGKALGPAGPTEPACFSTPWQSTASPNTTTLPHCRCRQGIAPSGLATAPGSMWLDSCLVGLGMPPGRSLPGAPGAGAGQPAAHRWRFCRDDLFCSEPAGGRSGTPSTVSLRKSSSTSPWMWALLQ